MQKSTRRFLHRSVIVVLATLLVIGIGNAVLDTTRPPIDPSTRMPPGTVPSTTFDPNEPAPPARKAGKRLTPRVSSAPPACRRPATAPFEPRSITIKGITSKGPVIALGLDENDAPAAPSFAQTNTFAWYKLGRAPGNRVGNVLFNTHTFSGGRVALGNELLSELGKGDIIIVTGDGPRQKLCYRVTAQPILVKPADYADLAARFNGPPRALITVCANKNTKTGIWEKRAVWFARPVMAGAKK